MTPKPNNIPRTRAARPKRPSNAQQHGEQQLGLTVSSTRGAY
jgi:hypothetical protein